MKIFENEIISEFFEDKLAVAGVLIFLVLFFCALFPSFLSPQNPYDLTQLFLENSFKAPGSDFLLGTDEQGRDIFSAIMYGLRISLYVGFLSTIVAVILGFLYWGQRQK